MNDIRNRGDLELLVNTFYSRLLQHAELGPVFSNIDMPAHIPRIVHFWAFVLLDEEGYRTNVFDKHLALPLKPPFFDTWLQIFIQTVDDLYAGEIAEMAKNRASSLAYTFRSKWEKLKGS